MKKVLLLMFALCLFGKSSLAEEQGKEVLRTRKAPIRILAVRCLESSESWFTPMLFETTFELSEREDLNRLGSRLPIEITRKKDNLRLKASVSLRNRKLQSGKFKQILVFPLASSQQNPGGRNNVLDKDNGLCYIALDKQRVPCNLLIKNGIPNIEVEDIEVAGFARQVLSLSSMWANPFIKPRELQGAEITGEQLEEFIGKYTKALKPLDMSALRLARLLIGIPEVFAEYGNGRNQESAMKDHKIDELVGAARKLADSPDAALQQYGLFAEGLLEGLRSNWNKAEIALSRFTEIATLADLQWIGERGLEDIRKEVAK